MTSIQWQQFSDQLVKTMPNYCRQWLTKPYILTQHLRKLGSLSVDVLSEQHTALGWCRQITHQLNGETVVFAQVDVPTDTFAALEKQLGSLKNKPLGETLLYNSDAVKRSPFQFAKITDGTLLFEQAKKQFDGKVDQLWARQSIFYWQGLPLTVTEVFLPTIPRFQPITGGRRMLSNCYQKILDYAHLIRLHRPIPILLMLWPALWGLWIASDGIPAWRYWLIFIIGTIIMRSAGDIFNDIADRKLDGYIERTQMRPLATGRIRVGNAVIFAAILVLIALILVILLNPLSVLFAGIGLVIALLYPLMKRITYWPQLVLGFAYNWGIILAFTAVQDRFPPAIAWCLWLIAVVWTIAYDTMYALADVKDDLKMGVKSTAVLFGRDYHAMIALFQFVMLGGLLAVGLILHYNLLYFGCVLLCVPLMVYQHTLLPRQEIKRCIRAFNNNQWVGLLILIGIAVQYV